MNREASLSHVWSFIHLFTAMPASASLEVEAQSDGVRDTAAKYRDR
jgi:hypothetical protein